MKAIKLNITDYNDRRTSTTINPTIATWWGMYHGLPPVTNDNDDSYHRQLTTALQAKVNGLSGIDKSAIENGLLQDIERKIIEQHDPEQPNLL